jgi:hypothetical protein
MQAFEDLDVEVVKQERRKPLARPRCKWVDKIRMDLGEIR